jgi:hypothetical protein
VYAGAVAEPEQSDEKPFSHAANRLFAVIRHIEEVVCDESLSESESDAPVYDSPDISQQIRTHSAHQGKGIVFESGTPMNNAIPPEQLLAEIQQIKQYIDVLDDEYHNILLPRYLRGQRGRKPLNLIF